jgi:hypothetical protein
VICQKGVPFGGEVPASDGSAPLGRVARQGVARRAGVGGEDRSRLWPAEADPPRRWEKRHLLVDTLEEAFAKDLLLTKGAGDKTGTLPLFRDLQDF